MNARITIAIPCYNQAVFLFECLNSLLAQTVSDWEAILVDDSSKERDVAAKIVADYGDKRFRYLSHQNNRGLAASRNTAIANSKAPFVLCLDADDFLHPEFLETTLGLIQEHRSCDSVFTDFQLVGLSDAIWHFAVKATDDMALSQWIPGAGTVMRRSVWEQVGGYCESPVLRVGNEDWDFWIGAMSEGISTLHVPRPLYYYRRHSASMSVSTLARTEWKTREYIVHRHPKFFSVGNRAKIFRYRGLVSSAMANKAAGDYASALHLAIRAFVERPLTAFHNVQKLPVTVAQKLATLTRRTIDRVQSSISRSNPASTSSVNNAHARTASTIHGESASSIHHRCDYLSYDYPVIEEAIRTTNAASVLEIGSGSGRLVPVYLKCCLNPILLQDISEEALAHCRRRFHYQTQLLYFSESATKLPANIKVDLIVSVRVLQHCFDDAEMWSILEYLTSRTTAFFLNELTAPEPGVYLCEHSKGRNYEPHFRRLGFRLIESGYLRPGSGSPEKWELFAKEGAGNTICPTAA